MKIKCEKSAQEIQKNYTHPKLNFDLRRNVSSAVAL